MPLGGSAALCDGRKSGGESPLALAPGPGLGKAMLDLTQELSLHLWALALLPNSVLVVNNGVHLVSQLLLGTEAISRLPGASIALLRWPTLAPTGGEYCLFWVEVRLSIE